MTKSGGERLHSRPFPAVPIFYGKYTLLTFFDGVTEHCIGSVVSISRSCSLYYLGDCKSGDSRICTCVEESDSWVSSLRGVFSVSGRQLGAPF